MFFFLSIFSTWIRIRILNADPDLEGPMNADPDPQPCFVHDLIVILLV